MPAARDVPWITLLVTLGITSVAAMTGGTDPTQPVKFLCFGLLMAAGFGFLVAALVTGGRMVFATGPSVLPLLLFFGVLLLATATSPTPVLSLFGTPARFDGLLIYGMLAVMVYGALPSADQKWSERFLLAMVGTLAVQALAGLLEGADLLPPLGPGITGLRGTLGNPNFFGAYVGLGAGPALWLALSQSRSRPVRAGAGVLVGGAVVLAVLSNASQGPVTAAISLGFVALGRGLLTPDRSRRRAVIGALGLTAGTGVAVLSAGFAGTGPLAAVADPTSYLLRTFYWRAAIRMGLDSPITGIGLDRFLYAYREYRPVEAVIGTPLTARVDAAHNVFLQFFAGGGFPLLLTYLLLMAVTGVAGVRLLIRTSGEERLLHATVLGVWVAYLAQSVVSIDVLPLPIVGWIAAALLLGQGLPLRSVAAGRPARLGARGRRGPARPRPLAGLAAALIILVVMVPAFIFFPRPWRGDRAYESAQQLEAAGDLVGAAEEFQASAALMPWNPEPIHEAGQVYLALNDGPRAKAALLEAERRAGGGYFPSTVTLFRIAVAEGDSAMALDLLDRALQLEPLHPEWLQEALDYARSQDANAVAADITDRLALVQDGQ